MAKQTFTTGQVLTAAEMTALQLNDYNQTVSAKVASYTLVASDAGTRITMSNASATIITVNTSLFAAGDTLFITNIGAGACTITAGTATVSTASSLILAQYDSGTLYFTSAGVSIWQKYQGAAAGGGGKVLQVVEGTAATAAVSSSSTYADTGLTATITPSSATSKILVFASMSGCGKSASDSSLGMRLMRNAVTISTHINIGNTGSAATNLVGTATLNKLDAPSLTSAITYKVQFRNNDALANANIMSGNSDAAIILMEIGA
jgi:hypothetical protein